MITPKLTDSCDPCVPQAPPAGPQAPHRRRLATLPTMTLRAAGCGPICKSRAR